jgi:hypothetical protein
MSYRAIREGTGRRFEADPGVGASAGRKESRTCARNAGWLLFCDIQAILTMRHWRQ